MGERNFGTLDCDAVSAATGYRYSAFPTLSPAVLCIMDLICLISFGVIVWKDTEWRDQTKSKKAKNAIMVIAMAISIIDLIHYYITFQFPYFENMMRAVIILCMSDKLRQSFFSMLRDLRDSFAILITIFSYLLIFTLTVYYFYRPSYEGIVSFNTLKETYRQVTILFTTANYPDIFLPTMNINYFNCFLFMVFMLIGLYFMVNLLTANVFTRYQNRLLARKAKRASKRMEYIEKIFHYHDKNNNESLEIMEAKAFLADVFDFDYHNEVHRNTAQKILDILNVDDDNLYKLKHI